MLRYLFARPGSYFKAGVEGFIMRASVVYPSCIKKLQTEEAKATLTLPPNWQIVREPQAFARCG
jgi:hypothetical protein